MRRKKKTREKEQKGNKEEQTGYEIFFIACASLTRACVYQGGLVVWAHPTLSAVRTLGYPTIGSAARPGQIL